MPTVRARALPLHSPLSVPGERIYLFALPTGLEALRPST